MKQEWRVASGVLCGQEDSHQVKRKILEESEFWGMDGKNAAQNECSKGKNVEADTSGVSKADGLKN